MSFALPSVKSKPTLLDSFKIDENAFGVPDLMTSGFASVKADLEVSHPLMLSERSHYKNRDRMNMTVLRNTQGLHAPLRINMELRAAKQIGRLPFLESSNVMLDSLTGRDVEIGPEDIFNTCEFREVAGQPHAVVERTLGLL